MDEHFVNNDKDKKSLSDILSLEELQAQIPVYDEQMDEEELDKFSKEEEALYNSIRCITGIDTDVIKNVFDGFYLVQLQAIRARKEKLLVPHIGRLNVVMDYSSYSLTYKINIDQTFKYASMQAFWGNIPDMGELLESIISTKTSKTNEELIRHIFNPDELETLGILD